MPTTIGNTTAMRSCTAAFKERNLLCNIFAGKAIITSAVAGGITLNPVVFASLTGFGLVVKAVASFKKYDRKAEKANFARVEYKKILDTIRFYLSDKPFNEEAFLDKLKMVDEFISDHCMKIPAKVEKKIQQTFHRDLNTRVLHVHSMGRGRKRLVEQSQQKPKKAAVEGYWWKFGWCNTDKSNSMFLSNGQNKPPKFKSKGRGGDELVAK